MSGPISTDAVKIQGEFVFTHRTHFEHYDVTLNYTPPPLQKDYADDRPKYRARFKINVSPGDLKTTWVVRVEELDGDRYQKRSVEMSSWETFESALNVGASKISEIYNQELKERAKEKAEQEARYKAADEAREYLESLPDPPHTKEI